MNRGMVFDAPAIEKKYRMAQYTDHTSKPEMVATLEYFHMGVFHKDT